VRPSPNLPDRSKKRVASKSCVPVSQCLHLLDASRVLVIRHPNGSQLLPREGVAAAKSNAAKSNYAGLIVDR